MKREREIREENEAKGGEEKGGLENINGKGEKKLKRKKHKKNEAHNKPGNQ